jgi:hypothetical protein
MESISLAISFVKYVNHDNEKDAVCRLSILRKTRGLLMICAINPTRHTEGTGNLLVLLGN